MSERRRIRVWPVALAIVVLLFTSGMVTILATMAVWPGEAKLTAPLLCDDARSDPFVVRDTYNVRPGETSMTFTLYCVGPRGDHDEIGWFKPFMLLWVLHTVLLVALLLAVVGRRRVRKRRAAPADAPGPTDARV